MIEYFQLIAKIANLETGEEQDGHASGADAIAILDGLITNARAQVARTPTADAIDNVGLALIKSMSGLIEEAIDSHIYCPSEKIPDDCQYQASVVSAEAYLTAAGNSASAN